MSTPPKRDAKAVAKRRADARRRNREIGRHLFAYGIVAILVISTVATVLVPSAIAPTSTTTTTPLVPTQPANTGFDQLLTQADQEVAASNWVTATGLYKAYLSQNPTRADVQLKVAKAIISSPSPNYLEAAQYLQQAIELEPQGSAIATEAKTLLDQIQPNVATAQAAATATPTSAVTGTTTLVGTALPIATSAITGTITITGTATATLPGEPVGPIISTATATTAPVGTRAP